MEFLWKYYLIKGKNDKTTRAEILHNAIWQTVINTLVNTEKRGHMDRLLAA